MQKALKIVEGLRRQKDLQARIDELMAEGEAQVAAGKYPEAQVSFEGVLRLDPGNARAQERLELAERKTGEGIFARFLPNQAPLLTLLEPGQGALVAYPSVAVVGVATDDRGMSKVELRIGGRAAGEATQPADLGAAEARRTLSFQTRLALEPGQNEITVTAIDDAGAERRESLLVTRRLRFHETSWFLPLGGGLFGGPPGPGLRGPGLPPARGAPAPLQPLHRGRPRAWTRPCSSGARSC